MIGFHSLVIDTQPISKWVIPPLTAAMFVVLGAGTASASCTTTPAICQAICSKDCCDATNLTTPADPDALSKIPVKALKAELAGAKRGTGFEKMLKREVARRGG